MLQIRNPRVGCIVNASKHHPNLDHGLYLGMCSEVQKGVIEVTNKRRRFAVFTSDLKTPFFDYWYNQQPISSNNLMLISSIIEEKFNGKSGAFAKFYGITTQNTSHWKEKRFILYNNLVYSPRHLHDSWIERLEVDPSNPTLLIDIVEQYYGGTKQTLCNQNKLLSSSVKFWCEKGWLVSNRTMYSPVRELIAE